jgi:hypothetical protein
MLAHGQQVINLVFLMLAAGGCAIGCLVYGVIAFLGKSKLTGWLLLIGSLICLILTWVVYEFF